MGCGGLRRKLALSSWLLLLLASCSGNVHVMAQQVPAVSVVPSSDWYGDDGQWSTVYIGLGDDTQIFSVFPNTVGVDILVVDAAGGCQNVSASDCSSERGWLFYANESSTWVVDGGYRVANYNGVEAASLYANYGTDYVTVQLSTETSSGWAPSNSTTSVATFNNTDPWVGYIGLGLWRSDLSDLDDPTFMENVWDDRSAVPSCSYGYTAGAYYQLKGVPASLTLGGFDALRFTPNDVSFNLSLAGLPVISLSTISVISVDSENNTVLSSSFETTIDAYFTIDSSTSYIWLPEATCDAFSAALNLTYDSTLDLYTYGDVTAGVHDELASANLTFTFSITDTSDSSQAVNITLPFSAFDHSLSYPYPNLVLNDTSATVPYFPIKRASSTDQYRLGRLFLQESYLVVDYERNNFSVYQASFNSAIMSSTNIIVIEPPPDSEYPGKVRPGLSTGATAGTIVGSLAGLAVILFCVWWFFLRKRYKLISCLRRREPKSKKGKREIQGPDSQTSLAPRRWRNWLYRGRAEIEGDHVHPSELSAVGMIHELPGSMPGDDSTTSKQALRRSTASAAASSIVTFSSSARMSMTSNGSIDEEELISPRTNSRPSSITKFPLPSETTDTEATSTGADSGPLRSTRNLPGEIVLGPTAETADRRSA